MMMTTTTILITATTLSVIILISFIIWQRNFIVLHLRLLRQNYIQKHPTPSPRQLEEYSNIFDFLTSQQ